MSFRSFQSCGVHVNLFYKVWQLVWYFHTMLVFSCFSLKYLVVLHVYLSTYWPQNNSDIKKGLLNVVSHFSIACLFKMSRLSFKVFLFCIFFNMFECFLDQAFCSAPDSWQKELQLVVRRISYLHPSCRLCVHWLLDAGTVCINLWGLKRRKNEVSLQKHVLLFVDLYCNSRIRGIIYSLAWYLSCLFS